MKKLLALSLLVVFALSSVAFAAPVGHRGPVADSKTPPTLVAPSGPEIIAWANPEGAVRAFVNNDANFSAALGFTPEIIAAIRTAFAENQLVPINIAADRSETEVTTIHTAILAAHSGYVRVSFTLLPPLSLGVTPVRQNFAVNIPGGRRAGVLKYHVNPVRDMPAERFLFVPNGNDEILFLLDVDNTSASPFVGTGTDSGRVNLFFEETPVDIVDPTRDSSGCNAGLPLIAGILALSAFVFSRRK